MTRPVGLANSPFYVRDSQHWAVEQEQYRHDQGMWSIGELAMFALMWKVEDFQNGLVQRCSRCYTGGTDVENRAAAVFNQPTKNQCPDCYGTTFEGGIRAKIIRPAIFTDADDQETVSEHGTTYPQNVTVESTSDFRFRNGDYVFRADGSRWQLAAPTRVTVRTGFEHPSQNVSTLGYGPALVSLEDKTSVAYLIPPTTTVELRDLLHSPSHYPSRTTDVINGPLIPPAWTD